MADFSLMWPSDCTREFKELSDDCCNDLSLEQLCARLSKKEYDRNVIFHMLRQMPASSRVVKYRVEVFDDILRHPELRRNVAELLDELEFLKSLHKHARDSEAASIWQIINRLNELDSYIDCVTGIKNTLEHGEIHSEGLKELLKLVQHIHSDSGFPALKEDIKRVVTDTGNIKSITLGVNLNRSLSPVEVGVVSVNNKPYTRAGVLKNFYEFTALKDGLHEGTENTSMKFHAPKTGTGVLAISKQSASKSAGVLTGLATINGQTVGIVSTRSRYNSGKMDANGAAKAARFVRFCDAFSIPVITLVDTYGFETVRDAAKLMHAYAEATTVKMAIIIGAAYGPAFVALAGRAANADFTVAWPNAVIAPLAPETFTAIMYNDELKGVEDPIAKRAEIEDDYRNTLASPAAAASEGYIDDVIAPADTRASVVAALDMLASKKVSRLPKKHSNIQL